MSRDVDLLVVSLVAELRVCKSRRQGLFLLLVSTLWAQNLNYRYPVVNPLLNFCTLHSAESLEAIWPKLSEKASRIPDEPITVIDLLELMHSTVNVDVFISSKHAVKKELTITAPGASWGDIFAIFIKYSELEVHKRGEIMMIEDCQSMSQKPRMYFSQ